MVHEQASVYLLNTAVLILGLVPIVAEQVTNCLLELKIVTEPIAKSKRLGEVAIDLYTLLSYK